MAPHIQGLDNLESLYTSIAENEAWQGNLNDDQRAHCLIWVRHMLQQAHRDALDMPVMRGILEMTLAKFNQLCGERYRNYPTGDTHLHG